MRLFHKLDQGNASAASICLQLELCEAFHQYPLGTKIEKQKRNNQQTIFTILF